MRPSSGATAAIAGMAACFLLGGLVGGWLGHTTASARVPADAAPAERRSPEPGAAPSEDGSGTPLESALMDSWLARLELAAKLHELQALEDASPSDLSRLVDEGLARLDDRELASILASTVRLGPEEIGDLSDLRAFSRRLAEIAMADVLHPGEPGGNAAPVVFTTDPDRTDSGPRGGFRAGKARIYAVFPTEGFGGDTVLVKWYRRDRSEILLFQRYTVVPGDSSGYVWLSPHDGWEPGQYRVDVFTGDEAMTRLATGRYQVRE